MVKQWLKIVSRDQRQPLWMANSNMVNATRPVKNWTSQRKHWLRSTVFGFVWEHESVNDTKQFNITFNLGTPEYKIIYKKHFL